MKNIYRKGMSKLRGVGIHTGKALVAFDPAKRDQSSSLARSGTVVAYAGDKRGLQRRAEARAESRAAAFAALCQGRSTRSFSRLLISLV